MKKLFKGGSSGSPVLGEFERMNNEIKKAAPSDNRNGNFMAVVKPFGLLARLAGWAQQGKSLQLFSCTFLKSNIFDLRAASGP